MIATRSYRTSRLGGCEWRRGRTFKARSVVGVTPVTAEAEKDFTFTPCATTYSVATSTAVAEFQRKVGPQNGFFWSVEDRTLLPL